MDSFPDMVVVAIPVADEEHRRRQGRSFHLDLVRVSDAAAGSFCTLTRARALARPTEERAREDSLGFWAFLCER